MGETDAVMLTRRALLAGLVAAGLVATAGCGKDASAGSAAGGGSQGSSGEDAGTQLVRVALPYSAGTGYEWSWEASDDGVLRLVSDEVADLAEDEQLEGGPLEARYVFESTAAGTTTLTFTLARSWDAEDDPTSVAYTLEVDDDLAVSLVSTSGDDAYRDCLTIG